MIENQVNNLLRIKMEDDVTGTISYGPYLRGPKWVKPFVQILSALIAIGILLFFGQYLWNKGLVPVMPNILAPIDGSSPMQQEPLYQLILTLLALLFLF